MPEMIGCLGVVGVKQRVEQGKSRGSSIIIGVPYPHTATLGTLHVASEKLGVRVTDTAGSENGVSRRVR